MKNYMSKSKTINIHIITCSLSSNSTNGKNKGNHRAIPIKGMYNNADMVDS